MILTESVAVREGMLILATAGIVIPIVHRLGIAPVLGYLAAGALLGPKGLGQFAPDIPWLGSVTIHDAESLSGPADLGVIFLLFVIGLELSLQRLSTMRRLVFGLGGLQILISALIIGGIVLWTGAGAATALLIGATLALSSTAVVVELLAAGRRLTSAAGRATFSVLLMQDLAVVPLLFLVGYLGAQSGRNPLVDLGLALGQATLGIAGIVGIGRLVMAPLFRLVAATGSADLFMAATLLVALASAIATEAAGLSTALGAFVAGLLIAETEFRRAVETIINPFKGLLLGVFFFTIGMKIDLSLILARPGLVLGLLAVLFVIKGGVMFGLGRAFGLTAAQALDSAILIAPGGEFAFIVVGLATAAGVIPAAAGGLTLTVVAVSMVLLPPLAALGQRLVRRIAVARPLDPEAAVEPPADLRPSVVIVGFGRIASVVAALLRTHGKTYVAVERDPSAVTLARRKGEPVYFGDAADPAFLRLLGLEGAAVLVITVQDFAMVDRIVEAAQSVRPGLSIVARARDARHASRLYGLGVAEAVPETIEASLQVAEATLISAGVAMGPIIASIHEKRDDVRRELKAAQSATADPVRTYAPAGRRLRDRAGGG